MSITIDRVPERTRPERPARGSRSNLRTGLLACGLLYAALYVLANDVLAAALYEGYSRTSQAISELSATHAPSRALLVGLLPVFTLLMIGFGCGVWISAGESRALRVTGGVLIAHGASFPVWLLAPMTSREVMQAGTMPANDVGHIALTVMAILLILLELGFGAAALGMRFRVYSVLTGVTILVFGMLTGVEAPKVALGEPTPWMGLFERISFAAWLLWLSVLSIALMRAPGGRRSASPDPEP